MTGLDKRSSAILDRANSLESSVNDDFLIEFVYYISFFLSMFLFTGYIWRNTFARLGEDWVFLALLGIIMAVLSFIMDRGISMCNNGTFKIYIFILFQY